jgi:primosomal protein N' (replication factor Y)
MELLLKLPKDGGVIAHCKKAIHEQTAVLHMDKKYRSVVVIPDVDKV